MKKIDHNYWEGYEGRDADADACNPDLRVAMKQLYGKNGFKFYSSNCDDYIFECSPDAYSSYASRNNKWEPKMPFKIKCIENNSDLADEVYHLSGTIAGEFFFPCHEKNGKTINQTRGTSLDICDRIDLTLRDIKYFYDKKEEDYPLKEVLNRYKDFFDKFKTFKKYVDFCLLNDFCTDDYEVDIWNNRDCGLPENEEELVSFWNWSVEKLKARAKRIEDHVKKYKIEIEE